MSDQARKKHFISLEQGYHGSSTVGAGLTALPAFHAEPIQGAGGVMVPPPGWMKVMRGLCREFDILFVADEVITGLRRTGPLFACSEDEVVPDLITVAKGLTSGYASMGAVALSDQIYETIADGAGASAVGRGHTYSAHPVSAAIGLEVLRLSEAGLLENEREAGARPCGEGWPAPCDLSVHLLPWACSAHPQSVRCPTRGS